MRLRFVLAAAVVIGAGAGATVLRRPPLTAAEPPLSAADASLIAPAERAECLDPSSAGAQKILNYHRSCGYWCNCWHDANVWSDGTVQWASDRWRGSVRLTSDQLQVLREQLSMIEARGFRGQLGPTISDAGSDSFDIYDGSTLARHFYYYRHSGSQPRSEPEVLANYLNQLTKPLDLEARCEPSPALRERLETAMRRVRAESRDCLVGPTSACPAPQKYLDTKFLRRVALLRQQLPDVIDCDPLGSSASGERKTQLE